MAWNAADTQLYQCKGEQHRPYRILCRCQSLFSLETGQPWGGADNDSFIIGKDTMAEGAVTISLFQHAFVEDSKRGEKANLGL
eukprot:1490059-Ditylum_brightwellii.AAC.1